MKVKLKDNEINAFQWLKPGDYHELVNFTPAHGTYEDKYSILTVYDYDDQVTILEPGEWIVEMFDGLRVYTDKGFKERFVEIGDTSMKKYKSKASCQKCGNNVTVDKYCKAITYPPVFVETDHIVRTCLNCGYEWSELPLDSEVDE